jgi:HlyD family secretion protein
MRVPPRRVLVAVACALLLGGAFFVLRGRTADVAYATAAVDRGDVVEVVGATGAVQAVTTVQVGSQVSGSIQSLNADFNSTVRKGQVLARLDPSLFQARVEQARANVISARANLERSKAMVEDTRQKYERAKELAAQQLLPQSDLDTARSNQDAAVAQVKASEAAVSQAVASLNQAQVDMDHTVIASPIDGVVIARNVDVGQTVAASLQAPVLFVIANDLRQLQVNASIDEADVGRVKEGQQVEFRVDAFPDQIFPGRVQQVRLQPTTVQNVVTYNAIITVDNPQQRLMPGMTATVSIVIRRAADVLRIPAAALRFRPAGFDASRRQSTRQAQDGGTAAAAGPGGQPQRAGGAGGGTGRGGTGGGGRAGGPGNAGGAASAGAGGTDAAAAGNGAGSPRPSLVFVLNEKGEPQPARVRLGISDGQFVEVREGVDEGTPVVTGIQSADARTTAPRPGASPAASNPFNPQRPQQRRR